MRLGSLPLLLRLLLLTYGLVAPVAAADSVRDTPWNDCRRSTQPKASELPLWWNANSSLSNSSTASVLHAFFDDYRQLQDIGHFVDQLQAIYPQLATVRIIGRSWQGRELRVLEITNQSAEVSKVEDKPVIFIEGGVHAREWIATSTVLFIAYSLLTQASSPSIASILRDFVVAAVAPVNPDGYVHSWEQDRMWRKTLSMHRDRGRWRLKEECNKRGVDANRNWGHTWGQTKDKYYESQLHDPCSQVYIGPMAFSEPEVQAVANYMLERQKRSLTLSRGAGGGKPGPGHVAAFLDFHSYAQVLLPPWAYTANSASVEDGEYQRGLTRAMTQAIEEVAGTRFEAGAELFPPDPGTGPDWAYGYLGVKATMTVELQGKVGNRDAGFCLPRLMIRQVGTEQLQALKTLAAYLQMHGSLPSSLVGFFSVEGSKGTTRIQVKSQDLALGFAAASREGGLWWLSSTGIFIFLAGNVTCLLACGLIRRRRWKGSSREVTSYANMATHQSAAAGERSPTQAVQLGRT